MKKLIGVMCLFILLCLVNSPLALTAAKDSLLLWSNSVLPALLPFFIASQILYYAGGAKLLSRGVTPLMKLLFLPPAGGFALIMSLLCGYPTGSRMCALLYEEKQITSEECGRLSMLCHNAGPVFISGTLATVLLAQPYLALPILCIHLCAALLTALIFCSNVPSVTLSSPILYAAHEEPLQPVGQLFGKAVFSGIQSILLICGYMVFFGIAIRFLLYYGAPLFTLLPKSIRGEVMALTAGSLEMTQGLSFLAQSTSPLRLPFICALLSFSGLCIVIQSLALLSSTQIKAGRFILSRLVCACLAFALCFLYEKAALATPILLTALLCVGNWCCKTVIKKVVKNTADQL